MSTFTNEDLKRMQNWELPDKYNVAQTRIMEWYARWNGQCYVSISGKDSTAVAYMCAQVCEALGYKLTLWYSDTGLEFPEVKQHVKDYTDWLRNHFQCEVELVWNYPVDRTGKRITFKHVIEKYGYPLISKEQSQYIYEAKHTKSEKLLHTRLCGNKSGGGKVSKKWQFLIYQKEFEVCHKCCQIMKKNPAKKFEKETGLHPIIGTMASESRLRKSTWLASGCNAFDSKRPISKPISIWTDSDVWQFIKEHNIPYPSVYGNIIYENGKYKSDGEPRTGCVWCCYGVHCENSPNKFQRLKITHPNLWNYCMKPWNDGGLGMREVLNSIDVKVE